MIWGLPVPSMWPVGWSSISGEGWLIGGRSDSGRLKLFGGPDDGARWETGFQLSSPPYVPMLGARSFGHAGAGGQLAFGNDECGIGFAYLSNQMSGYGDARARELTSALSRCFGGHARER